MKNVAKSNVNTKPVAIAAEQQLSAAELALVAGGVVVIKPPVRGFAVAPLHIGDSDGPKWIKK